MIVILTNNIRRGNNNLIKLKNANQFKYHLQINIFFERDFSSN
jgi:hypothetical protein